VRVSLGVGIERFDGELTIEPGLVQFDGPLALGPPFVLTSAFMASWPIRWDLTLGRNARSGDPIVLHTNRRRAFQVADALRQAGFEVERRRRWF
jgi:hypothetical protein